MFGKILTGCIYIFYGKMGSGKTSNAMKHVLDFHRKNKTVWINFPINHVDGSAPIYLEEDPAGILCMRDGLFVIDEAYMTLNSREWQNLPKAVFTAFTHVRKLHMSVIVIAQSWMRIDKSIREVATYAREFKGSSLFGKLYQYNEYEINEVGEIIKTPALEYETATKGMTIMKRNVYDSFDTDYLFSEVAPLKHWSSAVRPAEPPPDAERRGASVNAFQEGSLYEAAQDHQASRLTT